MRSYRLGASWGRSCVVRTAVGIAGLLLTGCLSVQAAPEGPNTSANVCMIAENDRVWLTQALERWQSKAVLWLELGPQPLPTVIVFDARCQYEFVEGDFERNVARPHDGTTVFLGDHGFPYGPQAFAAGERFVMALPSVWQAAGYDSNVGLENFLTGVLLHEITHTRQFALIGSALAGAEGGGTDDLIQETFSEEPAYVADYEAERDLLFAAAAAPDSATARRLAVDALAKMRERRARWFTGPRAWFVALDDVFLTTEGIGQWVMLRHLQDTEGLNRSQADAIALVRAGQDFWTQDQGLALILVIDRLLPDWRARAFREPDWRAESLLAAAVATVDK